MVAYARSFSATALEGAFCVLDGAGWVWVCRVCVCAGVDWVGCVVAGCVCVAAGAATAPEVPRACGVVARRCLDGALAVRAALDATFVGLSPPPPVTASATAPAGGRGGALAAVIR